MKLRRGKLNVHQFVTWNEDATGDMNIVHHFHITRRCLLFPRAQLFSSPFMFKRDNAWCNDAEILSLKAFPCRAQINCHSKIRRTTPQQDFKLHLKLFITIPETAEWWRHDGVFLVISPNGLIFIFIGSNEWRRVIDDAQFVIQWSNSFFQCVQIKTKWHRNALELMANTRWWWCRWRNGSNLFFSFRAFFYGCGENRNM